MSNKNISIAFFASHYEVAMFEDGEMIDSAWAFTPEQVAEAVKSLMEARDSEPADPRSPADVAAYEAAQEGTEEIEPVEAPLIDQPSFPHDAAYASDTREGVRVYGASLEARVHMYAYRHEVAPELARAAVKHILSEES